ncbi:MAG TPA: serine/threonine-protein kinase [Polyangiaceae bacterium]|jgi:serine/threonine-protein kinase
MGLEAGAVLARSYRLLHTIGEGGMGRVWVAEQLALDRKVAVKVLCDEAIQSQAALDLFYREARATARVDNPHVIRVLDFDVTESGWPFLVLELLVGETLEDRVQRSGPMPLEDVREIVEQTCSALASAHDCGILHRDIKAENLFLQRTSGKRIDTKLLDFGIALFKTSAHGAHQSVPVGTPQYMSPEQMLTVELDERADLFSVAVCAYYALTGAFPYTGDTVAEIGCALSRGTFVPASTLRPGLPIEVDAWFERTLAIPVDRRFPTAEEMASAFTQACRTEIPVDWAAPRPSGPAAGVAVEVVDLPDLHDGWPRAVWQTMGAIAALACVLVAVHAELDRGEPPAVDTQTHTTAASMAAPAAEMPAPSAHAPERVAADVVVPVASVSATAEVVDAGVPLVAAPAPTHVVRAPRVHRHAQAPVIPGTEGFGARE